MFTFNRNEQIVLLLLCGTLLVGIVISYLDKRNPDDIPDFEVHKNAVPVPEAIETSAKHDTDAPIAINLATEKDFQRLPGIGPQIASRIVAYREQHGAFKTIDDLTQVSGIGPKTLERLRPHLSLSAP
ncbi:MAG: helix-hairpin-helix domain-containing protein [Candidatus Latescibacteria bacterium]|jgi:comEA protein|nr:helix-hairpin-helix domain-containing protein [Candidatus Latescibacterota bacterium]